MPDLPRPLPHLSTQVPCTLLARRGNPGWRGGGRGGYGGPTPTLPPTNLTLKTPNSAPTPTRAACRAPPEPGGEVHGKQYGWGKGLGGFSRPLTQPSPPPSQERPPPSDVRADGRRNTWEGGGYGGVNGRLSVEQSRGSCPGTAV